ncbi:MAG TPA: M12 family metallo-peptidase [Rubricoccaceae bacterium]|nr:M12 family metallo-peptidase [Rubricoccaceae bacterium]
MLRLLVAAFGLLLAPALAAQPQEGLFRDVQPTDTEAAYEAAQRPSVARYRFVSVDAARVLAAPEQLRLDLFPDADAVAVRERVRRHHPGHLAWDGTFGTAGGSALFTVVDGHVVGRFVYEGRTYVLEPTAAGASLLYELNEAALPETDDAIPVGGPPWTPPDLPEGMRVPQNFDILVVYTTAVATALGAGAPAYMQQAVDLFETAMANVGLPHTARLVYSSPVAYTEAGSSSTDLSRLRNTSDGIMDIVHTWRNTYGADLVALINNSTDVCGVAYLMDPLNPGFHTSAFSVSTRSCAISNITFPHELGHNFGARHDRFVDNSNTPFTYSHGLAGPSSVPAERFRTVLAYNDACTSQGQSCPRIPYYSDPDVLYQGRPIGDATLADNSHHMDNAAPIVAAFRAEVPVELTSFAATVSGRDVTLAWETASETNNAGFEVQMQRGGAWTTLAFVEGHGTTTEANTYAYTAEGLLPGTHSFRLRQVDFDGQSEVFGPVEAGVETPGSHLLTQAYPNPFNPQTQFSLSVAQSQDVTVALYNALGQRVSTLFSGAMEADAARTFAVDGAALASGLYVVRVTGETFQDALRVSLVK